jgi:hypothetical protein
VNNKYRVHLMSGRVLIVNAKNEAQATRYAIVWHQYTDAVELVQLIQNSVRGIVGVVKVQKVGS